MMRTPFPAFFPSTTSPLNQQPSKASGNDGDVMSTLAHLYYSFSHDPLVVFLVCVLVSIDRASRLIMCVCVFASIASTALSG